MNNIIKLDDSRKKVYVEYEVRRSEINKVKEYIADNYPKYIKMYKVDKFDLATVSANIIQKIANGWSIDDEVVITELRSVLYDDVNVLTSLPIVEDL